MTVKRHEARNDSLGVTSESAKAIQLALEKAGVAFVFAPGVKPGVRPR
ncbi:hypothetical protein [Microvirga roseola]|nr:hypothetical protein [Microvirga roseola]